MHAPHCMHEKKNLFISIKMMIFMLLMNSIKHKYEHLHISYIVAAPLRSREHDAWPCG